MINTYTLGLNKDFVYDEESNMLVENQWHVIDCEHADSSIKMFDKNLNKLYNDNRYKIRIFYKLVLSGHYLGHGSNLLFDEYNHFTFNSLAMIGTPALKMRHSGPYDCYRGLLIGNDVINKDAYRLPNDDQLNRTYIKKYDFAEGFSIADIRVIDGDNEYTQQGINANDKPFIFASTYGDSAVRSCIVENNNVSYSIDDNSINMNVPNKNLVDTVTNKLMPLLFSPFGMSFSNDDGNDVAGWIYCVLGVDQDMGDVTFDVEFRDYDDTVIKTQTCAWGTAATPPDDPEREGYTFIGWEPTEYKNVLHDLVIYAQYEKDDETEITTFVNGDGDILVYDMPSLGDGTAQITITFDKPLSTIDYDSIDVYEFSDNEGHKDNVVVENNTISFTDTLFSQRDSYAIRLFDSDNNRIGQQAWNAGVVPKSISIIINDNTYNYDITVLNDNE